MTARSRPRRVILLFSTTVALIGVLVLIVLWTQVPRDTVTALPAGSFTLAQELAGEARAGDLTVRISSRNEQVEVLDEGHLVWSSRPGSPFLGAAVASIDAQEDRGYFWLTNSFDQQWPDQHLLTVEETPGAVTLKGSLADGERTGPDWQATFHPSPRGVQIDAEVASPATMLSFWSARTENAAVHGFGEQFTDFNLDGRLLPIVVREQGVGRGEQPLTFLADLTNNGAGGTETMTYAAWLSWVTGDLRGVRFDPDAPESHAPAVADLRSPDGIGVDVYAPAMSAELSAANSPLELISTQQSGIDRPELAAWAHSGAVIGIQGGSEKVRETIASLRADGAEIAGVWLQDWTGQRTTSFGDRLWWTWQLDVQRYPDWPELIAELDRAGIAVTTYVNPFVVDPSGRSPSPARDLFAESTEAGYLVTDSTGAPYALDQGGFDAYLIDLTNPAARDWFADVIAQEVLAHGVRGFMADFAEGLPFDAVLEDGVARLAHNEWPGLWAETVSEACDRAGQPDCVRWFRTGSLGMDALAPMFWNGDQLVTFAEQDGLASVLAGTFSAGVSGWPLVHSDIGGYTSINAVVKNYVRTPELLARWAELAAFSPMMRTHEGNRPGENLQVYSDSRTRSDFARATQIFSALSDYRAEVIAQATDTGIPAIRPMWLMAPGTPAADATAQFFFGDSILVAPVLAEGEPQVEVAFPPGEWQHLLTGAVYDGDEAVNVEAPLGTPAAFIKTSDPWAQKLTDTLSATLPHK